jgi:hypothetical protein
MEEERSVLAKQLEHPQIHQRLKEFFKGQPLRKQLGQLSDELDSEKLMDLKKAINECRASPGFSATFIYLTLPM